MTIQEMENEIRDCLDRIEIIYDGRHTQLLFSAVESITGTNYLDFILDLKERNIHRYIAWRKSNKLKYILSKKYRVQERLYWAEELLDRYDYRLEDEERQEREMVALRRREELHNQFQMQDVRRMVANAEANHTVMSEAMRRYCEGSTPWESMASWRNNRSSNVNSKLKEWADKQEKIEGI